MKYILILIIFLSSFTLFSQSIAITGGLNYNSFFDFKQDGNYYSSSYSSDFGYSVGVELDDIKVRWLKLRLTFNYDKYGGKIAINEWSLGFDDDTNAEIDKSIISLGIFPLNFKIIDRININLGLEMAGLISEDIIGTQSYWENGQYVWIKDLSDTDERFCARAYFGLRGRIAYDIRISDNLVISPQYSYYLGLSNEFVTTATKSIRHYFCIGLQRKIKAPTRDKNKLMAIDIE